MRDAIEAALRASPRVWGICLRDVPGLRADDGVPDAIDRTALAGATVLQLPSVLAASPTLDVGELRAARDHADAVGVRLTAALPPAHPDRIDAEWGTDPDAPRHPLAQLRAGEDLGIASWHVTVGGEADRFRLDPSWAAQLDRTVSVLRSLVAAASCPVVLKTHEEMTTFELARLCEEVAGLAVGFSPVNVVARLEDPIAAAHRIASRVHSVYLDDCALVRVPDGLVRVMRSIGDGVLPWPDLLAAVPAEATLVLDLHRADLRMPLHTPAWLARQPDLTPGELAALYRLTSVGDARPDDLTERVSRAAALLR